MILETVKYVPMGQRFGKLAEYTAETKYSATNKQLFLVTEGSYSAETRKSCFGDTPLFHHGETTYRVG